MVTMPCYRYTFTADDEGIVTRDILNGGTAGDVGALQLTFTVDGGYSYRVESVNGASEYDITELLTPIDGQIVVTAPPSWAVAGITTVRLVQLSVQDGEEVARRYFQPIALKFAYRDEGNGDAVAAPQWQELITRAEYALEHTQASALDASTAASLAESYAASAASHAAGVGAKVDAMQMTVGEMGDALLGVSGLADAANQKADELIGQMGAIDEVLDAILALQNALIGGDGV